MKNNYDLKKAVVRLSNRFKKSDGDYVRFKPTNYDIEALRTLVSHVDNVNDILLKKNIIFSKMVLNSLHTSILDNDTCVLDKDFDRYLCRILEKSLENHLDSFVLSFRNNQIQKIAEVTKDRGGCKFALEDLERIYNEDIIRGYLKETIVNLITRFSNLD